MAKILHNPDNGGTIKNINFEGTYYFTSREGNEFHIGDVVKIEDDKAADWMKGIYGFLREVTVDEAKKIKEDREKNKLKCDKCDYKTDNEKSLQGHSLHHSKEEKIDKELGIRVVSGSRPEAKVKEVETQDIIDAEASRDGLIGEGLVVER